MKRVLSLVLALSLVLGSIPAGFAATPTAGDTLKGYGLISGDQNGNLNEDKEITRAEMMVVLAQLLGKFTEAKAYSIPSTSKDVAGHWAAAYIAFAEKEAWTAGKGNGMFDPNGKVTLQETAAFMMKALGYTVTDYAKVVEEATKLNLLKDVNGEATKSIVRAELFKAALNTVNAPIKDSTQKLGEKLGVIKVVASALDPKKVEGISQNTIQITLKAEAKEVKASDFSVVDKDAKALEVKDAKLIDSKTVWISTADQAAGKLYTLKVAGKEFKVTGLQKDTVLPELAKGDSSVQDSQTLRLVFNKSVDPRNALVAANYTFTNGLTATSATFEKDVNGDDARTVVILVTSAQELNKQYKLTIGAGVTDVYGNKVQTEDEKNIYNFTGLRADTTGPRVTNVIAKNGEKIRIEFNDASDLSKDNALNVANYVFVDKTDATKTVTATSAKFVLDANNKNTIVELKTTPQIEKHGYEITMNNVTDKFGNALMSPKASFVGAPLDTVGPTIDGVAVLSNTVLKVTFSEDVDADIAVVAANYTADKDLAITAAEVDSKLDNVIWLTTSSQKSGETYKLTIANVQDLYKNAISTGNTSYFSGKAVDTAKPELVSATASYVSGEGTYVTVKFNEAVKESTAKVASNYNFGTEIGYGTSVTKVDDETFKVKVNPLSDGKTYTLVVNNVEDYAGNAMNYEDAKNEIKFVGKVSEDTAAPKLETAYTVDKQTVKLMFNKAIAPAQLKDIASFTFTNKWGKVLNVASSPVDAKDFTPTGLNLTNYVAGTNETGVKFSKATDNKSVTIRFNVDVFANATDGSSQSFKVKVNNTVLGVNGAPVNAAYNEKSVYSTSTAPEVVKIDSVTSINNTTTDIKFNQNIKDITTATGTNLEGNAATIVFTKVSDGTVVKATKVTRLTADKSVIRVAVADGLDKGAKYTVEFTGAATLIKDTFGDKDLSSNTDHTKKTFYVSSNTNTQPVVSNYTNVSAGHLQLTVSEEILDAVQANMKILVKDVDVIANVETDGTTVDVYYNNQGMEQGKTYTLLISPNALVDLSNLGNSEDIKVMFGVSSSTRDNVKIEGITASKTSVAGVDKYTSITVVFNKAVNNVNVSDFKLTSGTTVLTSGYDLYDTNGALIDATKNAKDYYSVVIIKLTSPGAFQFESTVKVDLAIGTDVAAQDGAKVKDSTVVTTGSSVVLPKK